jgi:hypothetical protein
MKKLILTLGIFVAGILCVNAQTAPTQEEETTKMVGNLTRVCTMTADQATKSTPFIKAFVASRDADKAKYGTTNKEELKTAIKADRETLITNLTPILSADQIQKIKDNWAKQAAKQKSSTTTTPQ